MILRQFHPLSSSQYSAFKTSNPIHLMLFSVFHVTPSLSNFYKHLSPILTSYILSKTDDSHWLNILFIFCSNIIRNILSGTYSRFPELAAAVCDRELWRNSHNEIVLFSGTNPLLLSLSSLRCVLSSRTDISFTTIRWANPSLWLPCQQTANKSPQGVFLYFSSPSSCGREFCGIPETSCGW